jgi:hypothetical protein
MKNIIFKNNEWILIKNISLTKEEKELISKFDQTSVELMKKINEKQYVKASTDDIELCENIYNQYKPQLKEHDKYELIEVNISLNNDTVKGIINCRINGEHKQIRF